MGSQKQLKNCESCPVQVTCLRCLYLSKTGSKTKSQSSFSGPPSRKLTLTIPQAQHQLSSSNHSAMSVYSYFDLLTKGLIRNNAKEWPTKRFNTTQLLVQNFRKAPFFKDILYQCTTNKSKSMFHIH